MLVRERGVFHHVLAGADDPLRDPVLDVLVRVVAVLLEDADPEQVVDDLLRLFLAHVISLREFLRRQAEAPLPEAEHEADFFLRKEPVEDPEIHVVFLHPARKLARYVIRDHDGELFHELRLLRIVLVMTRDRVVPLVHVDHRIHFFYHVFSPVRSFPAACLRAGKRCCRPDPHRIGILILISLTG